MRQTFDCKNCSIQLTKKFNFHSFIELNCPRCGESMDKINVKSLAAHSRGK